MSESVPERITALLQQMRHGNQTAEQRLFPLIYGDLHRVAKALFRREPTNHTLQPTAIVHDAYLRLMAGETGWESRRQFLAVASSAMRRVLVDHARKRRAEKRGGRFERITLSDSVAMISQGDVDLLQLEEAMVRLSSLDERKGRVVELRFFGGMTNEEAGEVLGVSSRTAEDDWYFARAWLREALGTP